MRFLPVSNKSILVELAGLDETLALFHSLIERPVLGTEEIIPAARTLLVHFHPDEIACADLVRHLLTRDLTARTQSSGPLVEIPVRYDGEDLADVAELLGTTVTEVVRRHTEAEYTVAFTGFAPGFAYLTAADSGLEVPRRKTPRTRIPAGAVALAGSFSGIYPQASPGGWQIIGVTSLRMFDLGRDPPAFLLPGYRVRFREVAKGAPQTDSLPSAEPVPATRVPQSLHPGQSGFRVISTGLPVFFQDLGRPGQAAQGISISGALDRGALKRANRLVGNTPGAACLEITLGGLSFEAIGKSEIALSGASSPVAIRTASGRIEHPPHNSPVGLDDGDVVTVAAASCGMRSYLAVRGGFAVAPVLGSTATDTLAQIGPAPAAKGDTLTIMPASPNAVVSMHETPDFELPSADDIVTLDVTMGPRTDWFTAGSVERLCSQKWLVTPQTSRVGIRLAGESALERTILGELPSEGTPTGAIQVPASGQPVLFLADHPLTGGYPVIAVVADHHLDLAGQIPIGAHIRFNPLTAFHEIDAR